MISVRFQGKPFSITAIQVYALTPSAKEAEVEQFSMTYSICQQIWKTQQWPQDWKKSVFIPIPKKGNAKECSNYGTIALI